MGYFRDMYGTQSRDFIMGAVAATQAFAIWRNGKRLVGCEEQLLQDVVKEIVTDLSENYEEDLEIALKMIR